MRASRGEIKIQEILEMNGVDFEMEYTFPDLISSSGKPLRFDFMVKDDNGDIDFLIEYQGSQHYFASEKFRGKKGLFQQQYNDKQKRDYCQKHGYTLVIIPYWEEQFIDFDYIYKHAGY